MDLLKALKRTTIISGTALLAFAATDAHAQVDTSALGHISASLQGTLAVVEAGPMRFGNFAVDNCAPCTGDATLTLSPAGGRTTPNAGTDDINLLVGTDADGGGALDSVVTDGVGGLGTGAQSPGFDTITNGDGITNVYLSFANSSGQIIDANHPDNLVTLSGPVVGAFTVDAFTFAEDDETTGYVDAAGGGTDSYGQYVACAASCTVRVGATLSTVAGTTPTPGKYIGTYYVMVSY